VFRCSGVLRSVPLVASIAILGTGCASSQEYLIRSDHFTVAVPRTWEVVRPAGPANGPAIVRVPASRESARGATTALDLYVYPWLERAPIAQPTQEAFQRLAADHELDLQAAGPPDHDHCDMLIDHLWLFGARQPVKHVETARGDHIIVAAGQTGGSLVALVGVVPATGASSCRNVMAMQDAMGSLREKLVGADPSDRAILPAPLFAPYPSGHPSPEVRPTNPVEW